MRKPPGVQVFAIGFASVVLIGFISFTVLASECRADFSVKEDAFSISNAPGYCFAMAAFARWYYLANRGGPCLRKALSVDAQRTIAKELQKFYSANLVTIQANYCNKYHGDQNESFQRCVTGLSIGEPRLVLLMNKGKRGAILHAVLAYAWLPEQNTLRVYDPNYPHDERFLDLDQKEYTSLDVTYHAICFPEVLQDHEGLLSKMEALYNRHVARRPDLASRSRLGATSHEKELFR